MGHLFLILPFLSTLHILDINPLSDTHLARILSGPVDFLFTRVVVSLVMQKLFSFMRSHVSIVSLVLGQMES